MTNNKLIIAAAGSGKTTFLINQALKEKEENIVIITYTEENESEIRRKFIEANGCIPANVTIQTWFSFLLQHWVRPYQWCIFNKVVKWLILVNGQSAVKYIGKFGPVCYKEEDDFEKHYFTDDTKIFSDKISKFVFKCNEVSQGAVIDRLTRLYPFIFIDEVQDLAGYDLSLLSLLFECNSNILLVWDPRQTTYTTHDERKFAKYKGGFIKEFIIEECKKNICIIDESVLNKSYRNNEIICRVSSRLYPNMTLVETSNTNVTSHDGVFLIKPTDVMGYIQKYDPMILRWNKTISVAENCKVMNFGASKGLWFDRVLIYPTAPFIQYLKDGKLKKIGKKTGKTENVFDIAKFYVALTRARFSVGIVCDYWTESYIEDIVKYKLFDLDEWKI